MHHVILSLAAVGLGVLGASDVACARGGAASDLEHARANARAGGPVSERDKELLEQWGCLSGTNSQFCNNLNRRPVARRAKHYR